MLVMFISKAGTPSHIGPVDYRPTSLSSFLLEVLKKLIYLYLRSIDLLLMIVVYDLLSRSQHAYITSKSVESALHYVTGFVEANMARGEYTL